MHTQGERARVMLEIADTSVDRDAETRRHGLEPFFTANEGRALGLPRVRAMLSRHDGDIAVASGPGGGTRMTLSFPVALDRDGKPAVLDGAPAGSSRRILRADDDPIGLLSTCEALPGRGGCPMRDEEVPPYADQVLAKPLRLGDLRAPLAPRDESTRGCAACASGGGGHEHA